MNRKRSIIILVIVLLAIGVLLTGLSWVTTYVAWVGRMPKGTWILYVKDVTGTPIHYAKVDFLSSRTGTLVATQGGPFDNCTGPGSVASDSDGAIELRNTKAFLYGGTYWKLFWVWPIGACPDMGPRAIVLRISAQGYKPSTLDMTTVLSQDKLVVTLYNKAE